MNTEKQFKPLSPRTWQASKEKQSLQMTDNRNNAAAQAKLINTLQRQSEDEETAQGKFTAQRQTDDDEQITQQKTDHSVQTAGNQTGMPQPLKEHMENSFARDLSSVRIHPESPKAPEVGALAYTQGNDIHFAPGQFKPDTTAGQQLLGHELTHVVQQAQGRVQPTTSVNGMPVNDTPALEHEADTMGNKAIHSV